MPLIGRRPRAIAAPALPTLGALTALTVAVSGLSLLLAAPPSAAATGPVPDCVAAGADLTCTLTYTSVGAEETYVVPDGVQDVDITAVGGAGGSFYSLSGGRPAIVTAGLDVTPGTSYHVAVAGGASDTTGGWNGGGDAPSLYGEGGGGASDVRTIPRSEPGTLDSRVLVAGGGGGANVFNGGGNSGLDGASGGTSSPSVPAGGGTQTHGGNGANYFGAYYGESGSLGQGGRDSNLGGGGGGGGLYGGGGGAYSNGGGGGSSLVPGNGSVEVDYSGQAPQVRISRTLPISAATGLTPDAETISAGASSSYAVVVTDGLDSATATPGSLVISPRGPDTGATCTADTCTATKAGTYTVIGSYAGFTAHTTLMVTPAPATTLTVTPTDATATAGTPTAYSVSARDTYGNLVPDESRTTTVTLKPVGGGESLECSEGVCSPTAEGEYVLRAERPASGGADRLTATTSLTVTHARLALLTLSPDLSDSTAGVPVAYTVTGADAFGNSLGDQTAASTVTLTRTGNDGGGDPVACPDAVCTPQTSGTYRVTALQGNVVDSAALDVAAATATLTLDPIGDVTFGEDVPTSATLSVGSSGSTPPGTVQFVLDGDEVGDPVPVPGDGRITGPTLSTLTAGMHTLAVRFASEPEGAFVAAPTQNAFVVAHAPTTTDVQVRADSLIATVDGGTAGVPEGSVDFAIDGRRVGSAPLVDGVATLAGDTAGGADSVVAARYAGSRDFGASSGSTARQDPAIVASLSSTTGEPRDGWYSGPVTVSFTCTEGSAPVTCPEPVVLDAEGAAQSVTRTAAAEDGGVATTTAGPVSIDLTAPTAQIGRVVAGRTYNGRAPRARCLGTDALSGVSTCEVTTTSVTYPGPVTSTVTVTDAAGNTSTVTAAYQVRDLWVSASEPRRGAWDVQSGRRVRTHVVSTGRPLLTGGVATGRFRFVDRMLGRAHWRGALTVPESVRPGTVIEVRMSTGEGPRVLRLRVIR